MDGEESPAGDGEAVSGRCGDDLTWILGEDGTLTVSGTGAMTDYKQVGDIPWWKHQDEIRAVVFEKGVSGIGCKAFYYCDALTDVTIPDTVRNIGDEAFFFCEALSNVTIPQGVTSIGRQAFHDCSLGDLSLPDSVVSIGKEAFRAAGLTSLSIPASVTDMGSGAFSANTALTQVTIQEGLTTLGEEAFRYCRHLTSLTIPASVTSIGHGAFGDCIRLTEFQVVEGNPVFSSVDGLLLSQDQKMLIRVPEGRVGLFTVPDYITSIGAEAFYGCGSLTRITIPGSVTEIGSGAFVRCDWLASVTMLEGLKSIADKAFYNCPNLKTVTIPASVTDIGEELFYTKLEDVYYGGSRSDWNRLVPPSVTSGVITIGQGVAITPSPVSEDEECRFYGGLVHFNSEGPEEENIRTVCNVEFDGHLYGLFEMEYAAPKDANSMMAVSWGEAEAFCEARGGHLATLTSAEENIFVHDHLNGASSAYFGLRYDWNEGEWIWVTGEPVEYTCWGLGQPPEYMDDHYSGNVRYKVSFFGNRRVVQQTWENSRFLYTHGDSDNSAVFICEWDDTDLDGLNDYWELFGADLDGDHIVDIDLPAMGADPYTPDLFVEVDWMAGLKPDAESLRMAADQFRAHGIRLHIDAGPDSTDYVTGKTWGALSGGNEVPYAESFEPGEDHARWTEMVEANFAESRRAVFRHCLYVNRIGQSGVPGLAGGVPSQYFLIADGDGRLSGSVTAAAGVFMHELGHTLGLRHGGSDDVRLKPNFLSVMNPLFQFSGLMGTDAVNYSEFILPELSEYSINETTGVDPEGVTVGSGLGTKWISGGGSGARARFAGEAAGGIDFNGDREYDTYLSCDVNGDGKRDYLQASVKEWERLVYTVGGIGHILTKDEPFTVPVGDEPEAVEELTYEEAEALGLLTNDDPGRWDLVGDVNGDRTVNAADRAQLARALADAAGYTVPDEETADLNGDGVVDRLDRITLARNLV